MINWLKNKLAGYVRSVIATSTTAQEILSDRPSTTGERVSLETVLGIPFLYNAVSVVAHKVATTPVNVIVETEDGREIDWEHPGQQWLYRPTADDSIMPISMFSTVQAHACITGNGYIYLWRNRAKGGIIEDANILDPTMTAPATEIDANGIKQKVFVTVIDGEARILLPEDVIHIKNLSVLKCGTQGDSLIDIAKEALGLTLGIQKYSTLFFKNGAHSQLAVELPTGIKKDMIPVWRESFQDVHKGLNNSHKTILLENGAKIQRLSADNDAIQLTELTQQQGLAIANMIGIPPMVLGIASGYTSYSSLEQENRRFLADYLNRWLRQWEQQLTVKLLTEKQIQEGTHFVEFNRQSLTETDNKAEIDLLLAQVNNNLLSWEEYRTIRNLPTKRKGSWFRTGQVQLVGEDFLPITPEPPTPPPAPEAPAEDAPQDDTEGQDGETPSEDAPDATEAKPEAKAEESPPVEIRQPEPDKSAERLARMTDSQVDRLIRRLKKSIETAETIDLERHRSVMVETFDAYEGAEGVVDAVLNELGEELAAIAKADRTKIDWARYRDTLRKGLV